jgi:hypothetical protein
MRLVKRALGIGGGSHPTEAEVIVLRALLCGPDPRLRKIGDQLERAPEIEREFPGKGHFRVGPTSTFDDLSFVLEVDRLESDWLGVRDSASGRDLEFRVVVGRHGFLRGLEGRTVDGGDWPKVWSVDRSALNPRSTALLALPSAAAAEAAQARALAGLSAWIGIEVAGEIVTYPPATTAHVAARERELGGAFPKGYRRFLGFTDGLDAPAIRIHGLRDVYTYDNPDIAAVVVAWADDDLGNYVLIVGLDGRDESIYQANVDAESSDLEVVATDFADLLRHRLGAESN